MAQHTEMVAVVVHGGAGSSRSADDGCAAAAASAMRVLAGGGEALGAVVAAVSVMEDDERFNAGTGADLRLDGATIELDAALMDTRGRLGAVAALHGVKNPVQVARAVADTPHHFLCGEGALRLARLLGFAPYDPATDRAHQRHAEVLAKLAGERAAVDGVPNTAFARFWNYPAAPPAIGASGDNAGGTPHGDTAGTMAGDTDKPRASGTCARPASDTAATPASGMPGAGARDTGGPPACDTVGAVARDAAGHFAVAGSTGGSAPALLGRVGDTPLIGCGFYAGPLGAIAATGTGERIMRHLLAREVYQWIAAGLPLQQALQRGVDLFDLAIPIGLIGITRDTTAVCANRDMAHAVLDHA